MTDEQDFHDNEEARRFELREAGETASADYLRHPGALVISYVYAPPALRGTGAADRLMHRVAAVARAENRKLIPTCGYAGAWLRAHKAYRDLLPG